MRYNMNQPEIINFEQETYKDLCMEMRDILSLEKEIKAKKEELRKKILEQAGGDRMEYGIKVASYKVSGGYDWEKIAKDYLKKEVLDVVKEVYKKEDRTTWRVTNY